ncbi:MAG: hypothetical protein ACJ06V_08260 [Verrucomicrobiota bacterium]
MVSDAVCDIRREKLPDPNKLANVGSFFKNPVINQSALAELHCVEGKGEVPFYSQPDGSVKVPAAWLIDKCKFRGAQRGGDIDRPAPNRRLPNPKPALHGCD